jgi:probable rRNA maturation factor
MAPPLKENFLVINKQRKHPVDNGELRRFLSLLVPVLGGDRRAFSVVFVTDEKIRRLNRDYRGVDKPTDVLSFRGDGGNGGYLGDILISCETAYNQSRKSSTLAFETNVRRLVLHGLLHLMGYDHETDNGEMRAIERRLRRRFQC